MSDSGEVSFFVFQDWFELKILNQDWLTFFLKNR